MWKLTDKQKSLAEWIYETTGNKFEGGEPSDFTVYVNKYRPLAEEISKQQQIEHEAELDTIDANRDW